MSRKKRKIKIRRKNSTRSSFKQWVSRFWCALYQRVLDYLQGNQWLIKLLLVVLSPLLIIAYPVFMLWATKEAIVEPAAIPASKGVMESLSRLAFGLLIFYLLCSTGSYLFEFLTTGQVCSRSRYGGSYCRSYSSHSFYSISMVSIYYIFFWPCFPLLAAIFFAKNDKE